MILLCGVPTETSTALVAEALNRQGHRFVMLNQRLVRQLQVQLRVDQAGLSGRLSGAVDLDLADVTAVYLRLMDDRWLPELEHERPDSFVALSSRALHDLLGQWADVTPARVVNRYRAMGSNFSKPYQLQLIKECGFSVPATLVTNDPDKVLSFRDVHGQLIFKSISSERSIVQQLQPSHLTRLQLIKECPVQFQEYIPGPNIRVHTVGSQVFATQVDTTATDYRYAVRQTGEPAHFTAIDLDDQLAEQCTRLAQALELELAGIDLKLAPDGRVICLEVNPSPVFSYYEQQTGQPIAAAIASHLNSAPAPGAHQRKTSRV